MTHIAISFKRQYIKNFRTQAKRTGFWDSNGEFKYMYISQANPNHFRTTALQKV